MTGIRFCLRMRSFALAALVVLVSQSEAFADMLDVSCKSENAYLSPDGDFVYLVSKIEGTQSAVYSAYSAQERRWSHGWMEGLERSSTSDPDIYRDLAFFIPLSGGNFAVQVNFGSWAVFDLLSGRKTGVSSFHDALNFAPDKFATSPVAFNQSRYPRMTRKVGDFVFSPLREPTRALLKVNVRTAQLETYDFGDQKIVGWEFLGDGTLVGKYVSENRHTYLHYSSDGDVWTKFEQPLTMANELYFPENFAESDTPHFFILNRLGRERYTVTVVAANTNTQEELFSHADGEFDFVSYARGDQNPPDAELMDDHWSQVSMMQISLKLMENAAVGDWTVTSTQSSSRSSAQLISYESANGEWNKIEYRSSDGESLNLCLALTVDRLIALFDRV